MINIAVLGYGTVGSGVVEVINKNHASINKRAGQEVNIKYVLDLRDFPGDPVEKVLVHDYTVACRPRSILHGISSFRPKTGKPGRKV